MLTLAAILGISESEGQDRPFLKEIKEGDSQHIAVVDNLLQPAGRHGGSKRKRSVAGGEIQGRALILRKAPADVLDP
jgi:hypothetical protein